MPWILISTFQGKILNINDYWIQLDTQNDIQIYPHVFVYSFSTVTYRIQNKHILIRKWSGLKRKYIGIQGIVENVLLIKYSNVFRS